jgi:hypothetical protein
VFVFFFGLEYKMTGHIINWSKGSTDRAAELQAATATPTNCSAPTVRRFTDARLNEEVTDMYFTNTKSALSSPRATLLVALLLSTTAFAAGPREATLTNNERSAHDAIAYSPVSAGPTQSESADATLAYNEHAAQRAIANASIDGEFANSRIRPVANAASEATLIHNELSAQHAIVEAQVSSPYWDARRSSAASNQSTTGQSAAAR